MSPEAVLGPALAAAVRELIDQALRARAAAPEAAAPARRPVTVPTAAKATGISGETIRELIHAGRIPERLAGANPNPKRPTYLVFVEEVLAALERPANAAAATGPAPVDFGAKAAQLRARAEKRGG